MILVTGLIQLVEEHLNKFILDRPAFCQIR